MSDTELDSSAPSLRLHLRASLIAVAVVLVAGIFAVVLTFRLEKRNIHAVALEGSPHKDMSIAWQRAAMAELDLLPLYGSSELAKHFGNEPQHFFAGYPTGFAVSPVGRGGCTTLVLAEKIAAAAEKAPAGRKIAISLSPSWFFHSEAHHRWYIGNFSAAQASALVFSPRLSLDLKRDFARRMLDYPDSVAGAPLLEFALRHLVGERPLDLALFRAVAPLARLQGKCTALSDHFAFAWHILHDHDRPQVGESSFAGLDWDRILANEELSPATVSQKKAHGAAADAQAPGDWRFAKMLRTSREWSDLELLLRVAREMDLDPLLLSIPIDYPYYESIGVSRESLDQYRDHLHALADQYGVAVVDFADHQNDAAFFADHNDHLSAHGWLYMDRALDFFYHGARHQRYFAPGVAGRNEQLP